MVKRLKNGRSKTGMTNHGPAYKTGDSCRTTFIAVYFTLTISLFLMNSESASAQQFDPEPSEQFAEAFKLFQSNLFANAAPAFADFRRDYPENGKTAEALYYESEARLRLGQQDEAVRLLEVFDNRFPNHLYLDGSRSLSCIR